MDDLTSLIINGTLSITSILSMAYFAGRFTERINSIEKRVELQANADSVDRDLYSLKESIAKDFLHVSTQLEDVKKELHNVRTEMRHTAGR